MMALLLGCTKNERDVSTPQALNTPIPPTAVPTPTSTNTPATTPMLAPTFTPTPTTTPTPTPTATAVPLTISGNPRAAQLHNPTPQNGSPCGRIDTLDFPIDPPHAAGVSRGGVDFGVFRSRYDKYHAGEDWGGAAGRPTLGTAVYSVGHGLVMAADPEGWNRDKGIVIVQHILADGQAILSFYGHLAPSSVVLEAGDCVRRGDKVGEIGRPRTPPHLHFEIRTHMPYTPGPGYWPEDPTTAGWLPPSATIWQERLAASPGVDWLRPYATNRKSIGAVMTDTFVLLEDDELVGLNVANGRTQWRFTLPDDNKLSNGLIDTDNDRLYLTGHTGSLQAFNLPDAANPLSAPLWEVDLNVTGTPDLIPLPGGGVVTAVREQLTATSSNGQILWSKDVGARPFDWANTAEQTILVTSGSNGRVWSLTANEPTAWNVPLGYPAIIGEQGWIYSKDGIYRLNTSAQTAERIFKLPDAFLLTGDFVSLPEGGLLVAHTDLQDRRLIALHEDGTVKWDRSFKGLVDGTQRLLVSNGRVYLIAQQFHNNNSELTLYLVDMETATLTHLFTGGTRTAVPTDDWLLPTNSKYILINIGGGSLVAFNPEAAK
ncbi:MAG: peptidoglycan DD-metalloendopeptidase family protein [Chloroflexi bacterium]|nr:peptidoglycan DD-metalloendopeptidase family protein [Chloroflexota bacterium]